MRTATLGEGVELLRAWFGGRAFARHRHDTYAIGVTEAGVQAFDYRGREERSGPGQVVVLHPDEAHDGRAGTGVGFGYRIAYVDPGRIAAAVRAIRGRPETLPFVSEAVSRHETLGRALTAAFRCGPEPLGVDALVLALAAGLIEAARDGRAVRPPRRLHHAALERARAFLDSHPGVVRSEELEAVTGLDRYDLARQFRVAYGTSPYRYSVMRRLDRARTRLGGEVPLAELTLAAGFVDQAHFTRMFRSAFGLTPGRYARLCRAAAGREGPRGWPGAPRARGGGPPAVTRERVARADGVDPHPGLGRMPH